MASKQKESSRKFVLIIIALIVALYIIFKVTIGANVKINSETYYFYISETTPSSAVADTLKERGFIRSRLSLKIMAWISSIDTLKPGMYELKDGWSNFKLLNHFGKHKPKPTQFITLPESNSRRSLIVSLCKGTGIHPDDVWKRINDEEFTNKLGN
jgi:cell division protein YceG involved in septum cleavage